MVYHQSHIRKIQFKKKNTKNKNKNENFMHNKVFLG